MKADFKKMTSHVTINNPLREDAFEKEDAMKIKLITEKFKDIIEILGFDLTNDRLINRYY